MSRNVDSVRRQIEAAFSNVPYPGDKQIAYDPDAWECAELTSDFRGHTWKDVPRESIRAHAAHLPLFSPAALAYFLPAYLLAALDDLDVRDFLLSTLEVPAPDTSALRASIVARFAGLAAEQKEAIKAFLEHMRDEARSETARHHWTQTLRSYWDREWQ